MRARLMMKLMGIVVMLVLTVITAHSCSASSPGSPLNPATLTRNGVDGLCADQQASAAASGDTAPQTLPSPGSMGNLGGLEKAAGLAPGSLSCSATTTTLPGGP
jgi:hypothetical protein